MVIKFVSFGLLFVFLALRTLFVSVIVIWWLLFRFFRFLNYMALFISHASHYNYSKNYLYLILFYFVSLSNADVWSEHLFHTVCTGCLYILLWYAHLHCNPNISCSEILIVVQVFLFFWSSLLSIFSLLSSILPFN